MEFSDVFAVPAPTRFSIAGGFALTVVFVSMLHAPDVIDQTGPLGVAGIDKWIHAVSYAAVTLLLAYASLARRAWVLALVAVGATLGGVGVEYIQSTLAWRTMETADVVANAAGAGAGAVVWTAVWHRLPLGPYGEPAE